jgi:hypothetical protein
MNDNETLRGLIRTWAAAADAARTASNAYMACQCKAVSCKHWRTTSAAYRALDSAEKALRAAADASEVRG